MLDTAENNGQPDPGALSQEHMTTGSLNVNSNSFDELEMLEFLEPAAWVDEATGIEQLLGKSLCTTSFLQNEQVNLPVQTMSSNATFDRASQLSFLNSLSGVAVGSDVISQFTAESLSN